MIAIARTTAAGVNTISMPSGSSSRPARAEQPEQKQTGRHGRHYQRQRRNRFNDRFTTKLLPRQHPRERNARREHDHRRRQRGDGREERDADDLCFHGVTGEWGRSRLS
jgi:hypothetical protein